MRVQIGDCRLFFDVEGSQLRLHNERIATLPTLVLLHGGPGIDHTTLRPAFSALADTAQILYFDQRGHGRSDHGAPEQWRLSQWADDVYALCQALDIHHPILLGQSFGGFVAQQVAIQYPSFPCKLILSSTAAQFRLDRVVAKMDQLGGPTARAAAEAFWQTPSAETFAAYETICVPLYNQHRIGPVLGRAALRTLEVMFHFIRYEKNTMNFLPQLQQIQCETLVIGGTEDPVTTLDDTRDLARALPATRTQCRIFEGRGHGVFREDPDPYFALLREFIGGHA